MYIYTAREWLRGGGGGGSMHFDIHIGARARVYTREATNKIPRGRSMLRLTISFFIFSILISTRGVKIDRGV